MDYLKKIEFKEVLAEGKQHALISRKDLEQLKTITEILKKEVDLHTDYAILPLEEFKKLELANKLYKSLLLKKEKAGKFLEKAKNQLASLEADIREYAPEFHGEFSGLVKNMEGVQLQSLEKKNFRLFSKLKSEFVKFEEQIRQEIENTKEEGLGKYVYCLIPSTDAIKLSGIGLFGKDVYTLQFGDIGAVVSDLPVKDYRQFNFEENVKTHNEVIQKVMKMFATIPLAYNQVWKNEGMLEDFIKTGRESVQEAFKKLDKMAEFGLKISKSNGTSYEENNLIEDLKEIGSNAASVKLGKKFGDVILNAYYLIPENNLGRVSELVKGIQSKHENLKINFTGPWPPYNFVEINVGGKDVHT